MLLHIAVSLSLLHQQNVQTVMKVGSVVSRGTSRVVPVMSVVHVFLVAVTTVKHIAIPVIVMIIFILWNQTCDRIH